MGNGEKRHIIFINDSIDMEIKEGSEIKLAFFK